ncbi:hypothetical protein GF108_20435 [Phyllobacterium sp. SYP-B3895]|uniref:hypothetical protein n=1 Tax=Phyllobacterium sp. SYP-B3895 TaxID=2663240 RepID=UPI001299D90E|nr:hypothetical protein [Phyllobacterium sp. SYP-B3895]MRG57937.1 hypothetical protein [Phyllobacterium sp. SYP-B3895]
MIADFPALMQSTIVVLVVDTPVDTVIVVLIVDALVDTVIVPRRIVSAASMPGFTATAMIVACGIISPTTMMASVVIAPVSVIITAAVVTAAAVVIATAIMIAAPATIVRATAGHQDHVSRAGFGQMGIELSGSAGTSSQSEKA